MTTWHAQLRDIFIILVALTFMFACIFGALAMWQLYRLGRALKRDAQPVIDTALETVATVRDTSAFMSERVRSLPVPAKRPPTAAAAGGQGQTAGVAGAVRRLFRGRS